MFTPLLTDYIAQQILERLEFIKLDPNFLVFLGVTPSWMIKKLLSSYKHALALSVAPTFSSKNAFRLAKLTNLSDASLLKPHAYDAVFANSISTINWAETFNQWHACLKFNGLLMFSTFGVDTLKELTDLGIPISPFPDMHDLGDLLVATHFTGIVMDMEQRTFSYKHFKKILKKEPFFMNLLPETLEKISKLNLPKSFQLTFEIIYGHAWCAPKPPQNLSQEILIPISSLSTHKKPS